MAQFLDPARSRDRAFVLFRGPRHLVFTVNRQIDRALLKVQDDRPRIKQAIFPTVARLDVVPGRQQMHPFGRIARVRQGAVTAGEAKAGHRDCPRAQATARAARVSSMRT